jgi:LacI family transcriptional regulator
MRGHRVQDIAEQAGLSVATVDRVLHGRRGVSPRAVRAVEQAVLDLDRQQTQLRLGGRTLMLDVVMQAPARFSSAVRQALESELTSARPAAVRARFHLSESATVRDAVTLLDTVGGRGRASQGVLLKAPDTPEVAAAVDRLRERGIPVVTLVTDVHGCRRVAYVGLDNAAAGNTAAYLMTQWLRTLPGTVLTTLSRSSFSGERERCDAFVRTMSRLDPHRCLEVVGEADGLDSMMRGLVASALDAHPDTVAVYSIGGGNRAIATEFASRRLRVQAFIGHDLDADNVALLRDGVLSAVLHHELRADMRAAIRQVLRFHRLLPGAPTSVLASPELITPFNVPHRLPTQA